MLETLRCWKSKTKNQIDTIGNVDHIIRTKCSDITFRNNTVEEKVALSKEILLRLTYEEQKQLIITLLQEQVINQRDRLHIWSAITGQPAQIDTGYISQHLVSLVSAIAGQGMRGKGNDLCDGSEVKSANFLDSLDKNGSSSARWNFTANNIYVMERFLEYSSLYLVSFDFNELDMIRIRVWLVDVKRHIELRERYKEWMMKLGYPKFKAEGSRPSVNFQLFPPRNRSEDSFARHGNGVNFDKLELQLDGVEGSELIFHAEETVDGLIKILKFKK